MPGVPAGIPMTEDHKSFLDDLDRPIYKYGTERTPSGPPRYCFWFGRHKKRNAFALWKFYTHKAINEAPECVVTSYSLTHFVKVAKELGLHISKAEREQLAETSKLGE